MRQQLLLAATFAAVLTSPLFAQTNPLWHEEKVRNFLPHMTWPEVQDLLTRTDMVIVPVPSLEQHGPQTPIGTDFYAGVEEAKLIAQRTDVLVAPVLMAGQSPYHMDFPGTIALSSDTIERVYVEAAQSLIHHGFRRFLFLNSHAGNQSITRFVVDRINQETPAIAIDLGDAVAALNRSTARTSTAGPGDPQRFDRHGGVGETSRALYLFPSLVQLDKSERVALTMPAHLTSMLPDVVQGDPLTTLLFLAEGLKAKETGKHTSTREMSSTGVWSNRDPKEATAEEGRRVTEAFVTGAVQVIERWNALRPRTPVSGPR
jgi:creatinine amidohydrolase